MERKTPVQKDSETVKVEVSIIEKRWKKIGGGAFILHGRMIQPGTVFTAAEKDIPKAFRDIIIPVGGEIPIVKQAVKPKFRMEPYKNEEGEVILDEDGAARFFIVSEAGKPMNDTPLKEEEAQSLLKDMNS